MTTWLHYPYSHPWMPTMKRKHSDDDYEGDSSSSGSSQCIPPRSYHSPKRRRYDLSRGLSRLSLFERVYSIVEEPQQQQMGDVSTRYVSQSSTTTTDEGYEEMHINTNPADIGIPARSDAVVEEPAELEPHEPVTEFAREVRMRSPSSYELEKDRIVITDLDSSESESEQEESNSFAISSAVLSKLDRTFMLKPVLGMTAERDTSRAVVLYRPTPWTTSGCQSPISHTNHVPSICEDAMEID